MIQELDAAISMDGADQKLWSFGKVFKGRSNMIRWWMGTIITVWGQLSGQGAVNCEYSSCICAEIRFPPGSP